MTYLRNNIVLRTTDLDEVRESIADMASPHDFDVKGNRADLQACVGAVQCGEVNLLHVAYGDVGMSVTSPDQNPDGILAYVVTSGAGRVRHRGKEFECSVDRGIVRDMALPINAEQKNLGIFVLPLSKRKLRNHARALIGDDVDLVDLDFDPRIDFTTPGGALFRNTVHYVSTALDGRSDVTANPIVAGQLEDLLLTQFLTVLPNSLQNLLSGGPVATVVPYHVKRARDFILANADRRLGIADIAAAAGCSYRALQTGFMNAYGLSPTAYLRRVRLKHIRRSLLGVDGDGSVSDIARKWGFAHMGRFAQAYAREFGELPSKTLGRRA